MCPAANLAAWSALGQRRLRAALWWPSSPVLRDSVSDGAEVLSVLEGQQNKCQLVFLDLKSADFRAL